MRSPSLTHWANLHGISYSVKISMSVGIKFENKYFCAISGKREELMISSKLNNILNDLMNFSYLNINLK